MNFRHQFKNQKTVITNLFLLATFFCFGCSKDTRLVENGTSEYKIFVPEDAISSEKFAAAKLQKYIYEISNCSLSIVNEYHQDEKIIFVGFQGTPSHQINNIDTAKFGSEEYLIKTFENKILIAGGKKRGTLYGVIGFLSDYLNCRWYTPDFSVIPKSENITISQIDIRTKPIFEYREAWYREAYDPDFAVHNRLNPSIQPLPDSMGGSYKIFPFVHTFYTLVPPEQYFKDHPEYFSMVSGQRKGHEAQLCLTNHEVVQIASETVFRWIEENPDSYIFSVDQNDGYGFCECDNCKAIDNKEGSHAGTILHFVNQIAEKVTKKHPKVKLQTLAYAYSEIPPKNIRPHPIVTIRLCHYNYCSAHSLEGCNDHKVYLDRLKRWSEIADRITIWDYFTDFSHYLIPFPNFEALRNDIKFYAEHKCIGLFAQGGNVAENGGGEFATLRAWVFAQLMWNPHQNAQLLIDEFISNVYGDAAPFISSYINILSEKVKPDSVYFSIYSKPSDGGYLTPEVVKQSSKLFKKAENVASNDSTLLKRVELAYLPILYTQLYFYSIGGKAYLSTEDMPRVLRKFKRIVRENRIVQLAERRDKHAIEKFIKSVNTQDEFVTDWWIIGPFDNPDKNGLDIKYPPEEKFKANESYVGRNNIDLKWSFRENRESGYIDFTKMFENTDLGIAYARRSIESKTDRLIKVGIGSNDGVRMWVNGEKVLDKPIERKAEPNQDILTIKLNEGKNDILLKIDQTGGGWGFYFTILDSK